MIAVDTNILVRYAVKDDRRQTLLATNFLASHQCYVLKTVLLELIWVLSSPLGYQLGRAMVVGRVRHILGLPTVAMEEALQAAQALDWYLGLVQSCRLNQILTPKSGQCFLGSENVVHPLV